MKKDLFLKPGELVRLIPGQYYRVGNLPSDIPPFKRLSGETNAVLVDYQGSTDDRDCWTVLANDEILFAWEDSLSRI
tara:strand:- start:11077 stop:11307 length:231 start_codon:yes stop_codon:yes gene_type:complete